MIAAFCLACATWLLLGDDAAARRRVRSLRRHKKSSTSFANPTMMKVAAALAGLACGLTVGGILGWVLGIGVAIAAPYALTRLSQGPKHDEALARQAADVADLLAACVASGATTKDATAVVSAAVEQPARRELERVVAAMELGASADAAWAHVSNGLTPLATAVMRATRSGAPLASVLAHVADDLRRTHRIEVEVAARAAGVRAVAPLALCFLPAFLLLAVVPIVVDLGSSLLRTQG